MRDAALFRAGELREYLEGRCRTAVTSVNDAAPEQVRFSTEAVIERVVSEFSVEPVRLDFKHISRTEPRETTSTFRDFGESRTIPVQTLSIIVPMAGDPELLRRQASTYSIGPTPEAFVRGDAVVFSVTGPSLTPEQVTSQVQRFQGQITQMLEWANRDAHAWQTELRVSVTAATNQRKQRLDQAASLSAGLDIPLAPTATSRQVHVPVARKTLRVERVASGPSEEPRLADSIYEDVMRTISGLARAMERLPLTAARFDEEELRDLVLFVLNSNYEGAAGARSSTARERPTSC